MGGHLVTINDKEEYRWLQENIWKDNNRLKEANYQEKDTNAASTYYVGLNDSEVENVTSFLMQQSLPDYDETVIEDQKSNENGNENFLSSEVKNLVVID